MGKYHYFAGNALDSSGLDNEMMHFRISGTLSGTVSVKVPDSYLGCYHCIKNQIDEPKVCWNRFLVLDPENDVAKKALLWIK